MGVLMKALRYAAYGAFGCSALSLVLFLTEWFVPFLGAAISLTVFGALLLAADRALGLLTEIRNALCHTSDVLPEPVQAEIAAPTRSAAEIAADIRKMSARQM